MKASNSPLKKMVMVPTTTLELSRGLMAIIDAVDYERASKFKWHALPCSGGRGFKAAREINTSKGLRKLYLHRFILETNQMVDHKNHDALDNRRANLRICTPAQNQANRRIMKNNLSGFKGVSRNKKKWQARIKQKHLGNFDDKKDAARAYNIAAVELFGEFASLNEL